MTSAPPRLSITSNTRTLAISFGYALFENMSRKDLTFKDVFSYPPNTGLRFQYREAKILNARIFWQSDNATSDAGSVCLVVEDYGENTGSDTADFHELIAYPGSMVRKVWQNVSNRWFPTEPSDREFKQLAGSDGILTITVRHSIKESKLKGRVLVLMNVRLRGKTTTRALRDAAREVLIDEELLATTSSMEMVNMDQFNDGES